MWLAESRLAGTLIAQFLLVPSAAAIVWGGRRKDSNFPWTIFKAGPPN
ncbi:lipid II flippase Amj family protein [Janthinobacterium sp. 13]